MIKRIEYFLKNFLLRTLSFFSKKPESPNRELVINSNAKCLLIRINRIGDALVTTPFIHLLKIKVNPQIYVLADRKNHFVFNNNPEIEEVMIYDKGLVGFFKTLKTINSKKFDVIFDMHDDVSTTVSFLIAAVKCKNKIGLQKSNKNIYTHTVPRPDAKKYHVIERLSSFSEILGFIYTKNELKINYSPTNQSFKKVNEIIDNIFDKKRFLLGINISAGSDARFWGIENYKLLVNKLNQYDINLLLICHDKDYNKAKEIIEVRFILNPSKEFDLFAAAIQSLSMLFSPDTSAVFLADAKGIPVFEMFVKFKLEEVLWTPFNSDFESVVTEEPNLHNIRFEEVWNKFQPFLEKYLNHKG
jgi:ADP-heptose:LPS heptosyltransferase